MTYRFGEIKRAPQVSVYTKITRSRNLPFYSRTYQWNLCFYENCLHSKFALFIMFTFVCCEQMESQLKESYNVELHATLALALNSKNKASNFKGSQEITTTFTPLSLYEQP